MSPLARPDRPWPGESPRPALVSGFDGLPLSLVWGFAHPVGLAGGGHEWSANGLDLTVTARPAWNVPGDPLAHHWANRRQHK